jgi:hypothetical protein
MVVRLNDDFTLMEFVIPVLEWIFDIDHETALRLMRQADHQGRAECGIPRHRRRQFRTCSGLVRSVHSSLSFDSAVMSGSESSVCRRRLFSIRSRLKRE